MKLVSDHENTVKDADIRKMKSEVLKTSVGAYLGCLFLVMANKRYKPVKQFLHEDFLAEKQ